MMLDYTKQPVFVVNSYIWNNAVQLPTNVWDTSTYSYRPIFPVSDSTSLNSQKMPYILYDTVLNRRTGDLYPMVTETFNYYIVGDVPQIIYIRTFIHDLFRKLDKSAQVVNMVGDGQTFFKYFESHQNGEVGEYLTGDSIDKKYVVSLSVRGTYTI